MPLDVGPLGAPRAHSLKTPFPKSRNLELSAMNKEQLDGTALQL
jgi:hypothetical protein